MQQHKRIRLNESIANAITIDYSATLWQVPVLDAVVPQLTFKEMIDLANVNGDWLHRFQQDSDIWKTWVSSHEPVIEKNPKARLGIDDWIVSDGSLKNWILFCWRQPHRLSTATMACFDQMVRAALPDEDVREEFYMWLVGAANSWHRTYTMIMVSDSCLDHISRVYEMLLYNVSNPLQPLFDVTERYQWKKRIYSRLMAVVLPQINLETFIQNWFASKGAFARDTNKSLSPILSVLRIAVRDAVEPAVDHLLRLFARTFALSDPNHDSRFEKTLRVMFHECLPRRHQKRYYTNRGWQVPLTETELKKKLRQTGISKALSKHGITLVHSTDGSAYDQYATIKFHGQQ